MAVLEHQQQIVNLLETALASTIEAERIEQRMSHTTRPHGSYQEIRGKLESLLNTERAILSDWLETVGR